MILALDKVTPGIASDETLLYGVEVKFYSNKVVVNKDFETSIPGLRAIGDGASITRGLQQASANGLSVARSILKTMEYEMRSHRRIRSMACLLLVALLLSGCRSEIQKVVFLKPVGYHQVFKIDKEVCRKKRGKGLSDQLYEYLR